MWRWIGLAVVVVLAGGPTHAEPSLRRDEVIAQAERVADWQIAHVADTSLIRKPDGGQRDPRGWVQGSFYLALTMLADRSPAPRFGKAVLEHGRAAGWRLGERPYHADDQAIGAAYLWAARHGGGWSALAGVRERLDIVVRHPSDVTLEFVETPGDPAGPRCLQRWCWSDALFMAPPVYFELSRQTGDPAYATFAHAEFKATTAYLFDDAESLYFRDSRFFERRDAHGRKVFWARGNGWAFAGVARILEALPAADPRRPYYEHLFQRMAARLRPLQRPDGFWSPSLLAEPASSPPESSATGFFVYGMAYGVRAGLLPRRVYEPTIRAGWAALSGAAQPDGMVGWVQQVGDRPEDVLATDTQLYGAAAFLMAAAAVADLGWR